MDVLERFQWADTWTGLVPARLGTSRSVDLAALALLGAQGYVQNHVTKAKSVRYYLDAIESLRNLMNARLSKAVDDALIAVGLLSAYEFTIGTGERPVFAHKHGILALLSSIRREQDVTEVARAMMYDDGTASFLIPCARGEPSRFDQCPFWLE